MYEIHSFPRFFSLFTQLSGGTSSVNSESIFWSACPLPKSVRSGPIAVAPISHSHLLRPLLPLFCRVFCQDRPEGIILLHPQIQLGTNQVTSHRICSTTYHQAAGDHVAIIMQPLIFSSLLLHHLIIPHSIPRQRPHHAPTQLTAQPVPPTADRAACPSYTTYVHITWK